MDAELALKANQTDVALTTEVPSTTDILNNTNVGATAVGGAYASVNVVNKTSGEGVDFNFTIPPGPQGAKGDTGATGPEGPQGPNGNTGATGLDTNGNLSINGSITATGDITAFSDRRLNSAVLPLLPIFRHFFRFHKNLSSSVISGTFSRENRYPACLEISPCK